MGDRPPARECADHTLLQTATQGVEARAETRGPGRPSPTASHRRKGPGLPEGLSSLLEHTT